MNIDSSPTLKNVLLWNSSLHDQAINSSDGNFAFTGTAGSASDPFVDSTNPHGADGIPRTADDGLRLKATASERLGHSVSGAYAAVQPPRIKH